MCLRVVEQPKVQYPVVDDGGRFDTLSSILHSLASLDELGLGVMVA